MASMRFRNFGGIYQFVVESADDLAQIHELDPARWADAMTFTDRDVDDALFARVPAEKAHKLRRLFSPAGTATVAYRFARSKPDGWRRTFD